MFRLTGTFDRLLEKATSQLLLECDWETTLQITDLIRQNDVQPKYAIAAIKKKFFAPNPNVALFALQVTESCVKNCGAAIHHEVASKVFMDDLRTLIKATSNENVKNKVLELIQTWAYAFRSIPSYRAVQDVLNLMKMEGYTFPQVKYETDAMFTADCAPEWADGECCHRCRVMFSLVQRKHHCRNCGQIFCSKCSNQSSSIPKFGIEKDVRVCDACYEQLQKSQKVEGESDLPAEYLKSSLSQQPQVSPKSGKTEQELQEEEELQLALALSQSEAENKEKEEYSSLSHDSNNVSNGSGSESELARYLNRPYWEQKQQQQQASNTQSNVNSTPTPSAPVSVSGQMTPQVIKINEKFQNGETGDMDDFLSTLKSSIEIFVNRMKSKSSRGRPISNDSSIQTLFMNITAMHSQLLRYIQQQDEDRAYYEKLQDKLSQVKDAREALDALREDHEEKLRIEAEEAERQRQVMMAHKLEIMRKKKQEYLQYQRQIAMQRMQEQEREIMMRQDQHQPIYQQQQQPGPPPNTMLPAGVYPPTQPIQNQSFSPDPSNESSPVHGGYYSNQPPPPGTNPMAPPHNQQAPPPQYGNSFPVQGVPSQLGYNPQPPPAQAPPEVTQSSAQPHHVQPQNISALPPVNPAGAIPEQGPPLATVQNIEPLISFD
ncbi:Hepatocyte growth factor-regulated tyrosine kinase substrate [Nymphon striatum]|nr:Hepatocyte growth factor-regulated tyrosine kinase substrate [Nymphon striatum]